MSTAQFTTPLIVTIPGQLIASSLWNNEFINLFNNLDPQGIGAYSDTDSQMQTETNPFPGSVTSRPTALSGEIERLRFMLSSLNGQTYWYETPVSDISTIDAYITMLQGRFPVVTADIADLAVTDAKVNDVAAGKVTGTLDSSQIASVASTTITGQVATAQIADAAITKSKIVELTKFSAYLGSDNTNATGDGTAVVVIFNSNAISNAGYNSVTGIFTAPTTGNYLFSFGIMMKGTASGNKAQVALITTAKTYVIEDWPQSNISKQMTHVVPMTSGDTAKIQVTVSGGSKVVTLSALNTIGSAGQGTFFSGTLLP